MFSFNKEDVWIGSSLKDLSQVIRVLLDNNISYSSNKVSSLRRDKKINLKNYGINMDYETQYTISVNKRDAMEAKYLINDILNKNI